MRGLFLLLAAVLVLVLIGVLVAVLILVGVLVLGTVLIGILILVLVIHNRSSVCFFLRHRRSSSLPNISGFILGLENQADDEAGNDGDSDTAGGSFQATGEDTQETVFLHRFFHAFG